MERLVFILVAAFVSIGLQGCKWLDDFRAREQPQYLETPPRPTLNPDSEDYQGDDTHQTEDEERATRMPNIDNRIKIPEVPDYPSGM